MILLKTFLTQTYRIRAMYCLPSQGTRKVISGHDYKIEVTCSGTPHPESGLLVDRNHMNCIVHKVLVQKYDKTLLNHHFPQPTGEILCRAFFEQLHCELRPLLYQVRVQETHKNSFCFGPVP